MRINLFDRKLVTFLAIISILCYIIGIYILKLIYKCGFNEVILFNLETKREFSFLSVIISTFVFFSGIALLFLIPGWIILLNFKNIKKDIIIFLGLSFIVSILSLILCSTLFKIINMQSLNRINISVIIISIICIGLLILWLRQLNTKEKIYISLSFSKLIPYFILILITISLVIVFHYKFIDRRSVKYDYDEKIILSIPLGKQPDDLEIFGLANSLKKHLLPYWDLEYADRFGFVFTNPPLYPFICMFLILLFGENRTSINLTSIGFIVCVFFIILSQETKKKYLHLFFCSLFLSTYLIFFLQDHNSFIFMEPFFIFLLLASYGYLLRKNYNIFLVFAAAATLTRFYTIFFIFLSFIGLYFFFKERVSEIKFIILKYIFIIIGIILFIIIIGKLNGNLLVYWKTFLIEHFNRFDYFNFLSKKFPELVVYNPSFSLFKSLQFLLWCFYATAFTFPILFIFEKDKKENFYSFISIVYFIFVFFSRYQLIRYVAPLVPFTAIVISKKFERWIIEEKK